MIVHNNKMIIPEIIVVGIHVPYLKGYIVSQINNKLKRSNSSNYQLHHRSKHNYIHLNFQV